MHFLINIVGISLNGLSRISLGIISYPFACLRLLLGFDVRWPVVFDVIFVILLLLSLGLNDVTCLLAHVFACFLYRALGFLLSP